jgi:hypothetical protein
MACAFSMALSQKPHCVARSYSRRPSRAGVDEQLRFQEPRAGNHKRLVCTGHVDLIDLRWPVCDWVDSRPASTGNKPLIVAFCTPVFLEYRFTSIAEEATFAPIGHSARAHRPLGVRPAEQRKRHEGQTMATSTANQLPTAESISVSTNDRNSGGRVAQFAQEGSPEGSPDLTLLHFPCDIASFASPTRGTRFNS